MLELKWITEEPAAATNAALVVPLREGFDAKAFATRFGAGVEKALATAKFRGKAGESFVFTRSRGDELQRVVLLGVGDGQVTGDRLRTVGHDALRQGQQGGASTVVFDLDNEQGLVWDKASLHPTSIGSLLAQGFELGTYSYDQFLSEDGQAKKTVERVEILGPKHRQFAEGLARGQTIAAGIMRARDLGNGPAALVTPTYLAETAAQMVESLKGEHDVSLTVLDREQCEAKGMGCYLGVAQGSEQPPKFIHLRFRAKGQVRGKVCLIGKGVTFDSGGYSLKPSDGMMDMKLDMAGSAAVIGAFEAIARLELPWEVHVLVAATENMVSGGAYKLGDVLKASNGKTVEINNTDAEGRLTLADALVYGAALEPDFMVDFATLTGACMVALGPKIAGVMTPDERLASDWMAAADRTGEPMWRLPLPDDLKEQLKSKIADMRNTGERWGGALTAGLFLKEFTCGRRWMHVDIAGPAMASKPYGVTTPGGTGFPVATIVEFLASDVQS